MKTVTKYPWERINPWLVEIPASAREDMLVPARIYVDDVLWDCVAIALWIMNRKARCSVRMWVCEKQRDP